MSKTTTKKRARNRRRRNLPPNPAIPTLRFTPDAWGKLVFLRDLGSTEIGGFGIAPSHDPLLIEDVRLVKQNTTAASVEFDDASVADLFDDRVDAGLRPEQFARVWIHTHPAISARPSCTDEETFARCFGSADWAVMFILAREGETYARLRFNTGPGGELLIDDGVDWSHEFSASDHAAWTEEYRRNVHPLATTTFVPADLETLWEFGEITLEEYDQLIKEREHNGHDFDPAVLAASRFGPGIDAELDLDLGDRGGGDREAGGVATDGDRSPEGDADRF